MQRSICRRGASRALTIARFLPAYVLMPAFGGSGSSTDALERECGTARSHPLRPAPRRTAPVNE